MDASQRQGWDSLPPSTIPPAAVRGESTLLTWLRHIAPLLFLIAIVASIALYDGVTVISARMAGVYGFVIAVGVGLVTWAFWAWGTTPQCSNPRQFGKLANWCNVLDSYLENWCKEPLAPIEDLDPLVAQRACDGAVVHRNFVAASLGVKPEQTGSQPRWRRNWPFGQNEGHKRMGKVAGQRWMTGAGYVELWERLHRAEEDLFLVLPTQEIVAQGQLDELRLSGSRIANRQDLLHRLAVALHQLDGASYLTTPPQPAPQGNALMMGKLEYPKPCKALDKHVAARYALRGIRFAINDYRDGQRDGMVRVRVNLCWAGTLTALIAFAIFGLAMAFEAPPFSLYGAAAVYLVGAVVGLFNSLSISSEDDGTEAEEDYGLAQARLLNSSLLSGLAAIGGVVLAYFSFGVVGDLSANASNSSDSNVPQIWQIFDLEAHPEAVAVAALFGLTPRLLIRRLQTEGDHFRQGLQRSSAPAGKHANEAGQGD